MYKCNRKSTEKSSIPKLLGRGYLAKFTMLFARKRKSSETRNPVESFFQIITEKYYYVTMYSF